MGWVNKNVWIDDDDDVTETRITYFKFLRRVRRKTKIKRIFEIGYGLKGESSAKHSLRRQSKGID
jgi:hypothetical protein